MDMKTMCQKADESGFAKLLGMKTIAVDKGYGKAKLTIDDRHLNLFGMTHGAVLYALADHVCSIAGNSLGRKAVLTQSSTNFFKNPKPDSEIFAEGNVIVSGQTLGYLEIKVTDENNNLLLKFNASFFFLE